MEILPGKTVMLTGASGGLGRYMATEFAAAGSKLALVAFPGVGLEEVRQAVTAHGVEALAFTCDLRDENERRKLVAEVERTLGPVDILVNNAGVEYTAYYHQLSEAQIRQVLNVNLEVPMILSRLLIPGMLQRGRGHIVNISSLAGKSGPAFQEPYAATKRLRGGAGIRRGRHLRQTSFPNRSQRPAVARDLCSGSGCQSCA
jgi:short-subunit dehydrogenase